MPRVVINPTTSEKKRRGSQCKARDNTPTKAKDEPNPIKNRPAPAIKREDVKVNIQDPTVQQSVAKVSKRLGPKRSISIPTGICMGE